MSFRLEISKPKGTCPSCGRYGKFRYVENLNTGNRYPDYYGRCDRENSCGYLRLPNNDHKYQIQLPKTVDHTIVSKTLAKYQENTFYSFLSQFFGIEVANCIMLKYAVGSAREQKTVFWYKDEQNILDIPEETDPLFRELLTPHGGKLGVAIY